MRRGMWPTAMKVVLPAPSFTETVNMYQSPLAASVKRLRNSHIWERDGSDWYLEPQWVSERLFAVEPFDRSASLLDPCCGIGQIAGAAKRAGYNVIAADLHDRGYPGCQIQNFLDRKSVPPSVVGNPPFNAVEAFARHGLNIGATKMALVFPVARLNAAHWLQDLPFRRAWLLTPRPSMPTGAYVFGGGKVGNGTRDFCWIILERGYVGRPEICWLHRDRIGWEAR
jgi:hypothetical protein